MTGTFNLLALLIFVSPSMAFAEQAPDPKGQIGFGCYYNDKVYTVGAVICLSKDAKLTCQPASKGWELNSIDSQKDPSCTNAVVK
jgi:hypothetical protein